VAPAPLMVDADAGADTVTISGGGWPVGAGLVVAIGTGRTLVLDTDLTGDQGLTVSDAGELVLNGANRYRGDTMIEGARLRMGPGGGWPATSRLVLDRGTFDLGGHDRRIGGLSGKGGTIALGARTLTIDQATDGVFAGTIEGTGWVAKEGDGRLTLERAQTWTGGTRIAGGVLEFLTGGAGVHLTGAIQITGGALIAPGLHLGTSARPPAAPR
jgi:autotransporter-associated beta strand protein